MTGSKKPKIQTPVEPDPTPTPIVGREEEEAKKKVRRRSGGRAGNIFAGQLNTARGAPNNILNTRLG